VLVLLLLVDVVGALVVVVTGGVTFVMSLSE
jgi:hypothetical protein